MSGVWAVLLTVMLCIGAPLLGIFAAYCDGVIGE